MFLFNRSPLALVLKVVILDLSILYLVVRIEAAPQQVFLVLFLRDGLEIRTVLIRSGGYLGHERVLIGQTMLDLGEQIIRDLWRLPGLLREGETAIYSYG
jgi:hypothetical protein